MPGDISPSSSDDDPDNPPSKSTKQPMEADPKKTTMYQCPADFVSFCHRPCSSTLTKSLKNKSKELWLIKAPASFNPECFRGVQVPLSGFKTLKVPSDAPGAKTGSSQHIYSILGSPHGTADLRLLTSDKDSSSQVVFGPKFSGLLNVCESYGGTSANQAPLVIPAAPAPSVPTGLKQRFCPFGSKTPTLNSGEDEGSRKKKKRKKEKRIKVEQGEDAMDGVKVEPVEVQDGTGTEQQVQDGGPVVEERRRKKKKKRDREQQQQQQQQQQREEAEQGAEPSISAEPEVTVKLEPMDSLDGDVVEGCGKKKKKKKRSKTDDD